MQCITHNGREYELPDYPNGIFAMIYQGEDGDYIDIRYSPPEYLKEKYRDTPWSVCRLTSYFGDDGSSNDSYSCEGEFSTLQECLDFITETFYYYEDNHTYKSELIGGRGWV